MNEDKKTYEKILLIFLALLCIYGAYSSGNNFININSSDKNLETVSEAQVIPADNLSFDNSDGDIKNTESNNDQDKISYDNFLNIQMGMSYEDVKNILGEGKEISSSQIDGVNTTKYEYEGKGISSIVIILQNDSVTSKSQLNLKEINSNITLDDYNKLSNGISYDEATKLIGEGQLISVSSTMGYESYIYSYINLDGSNANFTFDNNGLTVKSQYNLK